MVSGDAAFDGLGELSSKTGAEQLEKQYLYKQSLNSDGLWLRTMTSGLKICRFRFKRRHQFQTNKLMS
ncbi:unnamed protein product, partial [Iphiclides podalirius]